MKCQPITRNNKQYYFFPDVSLDETTKGFLIDCQDDCFELIESAWHAYVKQCEIDEQCFSVYLTHHISFEPIRAHMFENYLALPNSQLFVVGRAIPRHSTIVRKKRVSAL